MPSKLVDAVRTQFNYMVDKILNNKQYFKSAFPCYLNYALRKLHIVIYYFTDPMIKEKRFL